jgi:putative oxidoreductase
MTAYTASAAAQSRLSAASLSARAHWLLRIGFSSVFLFHGIGKFAAPAQLAEMMQLPLLVVLLVALAEVGGGLAVLVGGALRMDWLTRLGGLVTVPVMIGAIAMVHWGQWSFVASESHRMGGMEFQVVLLLMGLYFLIRGDSERPL